MSRVLWGWNLYGQPIDEEAERQRQLIEQQRRVQYEPGRFFVPQKPENAQLKIEAPNSAGKEIIWLQKGKDGQYR